MTKEECSAQLIQLGLITKARLMSNHQENVDTLNEWAELVGCSLRFQKEEKGISWTGLLPREKRVRR